MVGWYDGESNVIFETSLRMDQSWIELLRICDRYLTEYLSKEDSSTFFRPKLIIFTSNVDPSSWYKEGCPKGTSAMLFLRRFKVVEEMTEPWVEPEGSVNNAEINNN